MPTICDLGHTMTSNWYHRDHTVQELLSRHSRPLGRYLNSWQNRQLKLTLTLTLALLTLTLTLTLSNYDHHSRKDEKTLPLHSQHPYVRFDTHLSMSSSLGPPGRVPQNSMRLLF